MPSFQSSRPLLTVTVVTGRVWCYILEMWLVCTECAINGKYTPDLEDLVWGKKVGKY